MWIGVGFVLTTILNKSSTPSSAAMSQQTETQRKYGSMNKDEEEIHNLLSKWKPIGKIPDAMAILTKRETVQYLPMTDGTQITPVASVDVTETGSVDMASDSTQSKVHYKNDEKMRILRGPDGFITGYDTGRDAELSEQ